MSARTPRIIVALDYAGAEEARGLVARLRPEDCRLKVGLELFSAAGPAYVRDLADRGFDVFLDLKFHDIPTTVARACERAAALGAWMINVHALGGSAMMSAARDAVSKASKPPLLIAVTILTSHSAADLKQLGLAGDAATEVTTLAALAHAAGLDGVVCSPQEAAVLRARLGDQFVLVTPGVRPAGASADDQARAMTPAQAISAGADFIVIGRPITRAPDPLAALRALQEEIELAPAAG